MLLPLRTAGSGTWVTPQPSASLFHGVLRRELRKRGADWVDGSVAHFLGSNGGTVTLGSPSPLQASTLIPGRTPSLSTRMGIVLTVDGAGIVNTSGKMQTIINNGGDYRYERRLHGIPNTSTAGNATIINNGGARCRRRLDAILRTHRLPAKRRSPTTAAGAGGRGAAASRTS